jgi:enolase
MWNRHSDFKMPYYLVLPIFSISEGLDLVIAAIERAGYNGRIKLAINVAATDFCTGKYKTRFISCINNGELSHVANRLLGI